MHVVMMERSAVRHGARSMDGDGGRVKRKSRRAAWTYPSMCFIPKNTWGDKDPSGSATMVLPRASSRTLDSPPTAVRQKLPRQGLSAWRSRSKEPGSKEGSGRLVGLAEDIDSPRGRRYTFRPRGAVAQLGERLNGIQEVESSILFGSTIFNSLTFRFCAQADGQHDRAYGRQSQLEVPTIWLAARASYFMKRERRPFRPQLLFR